MTRHYVARNETARFASAPRGSPAPSSHGIGHGGLPAAFTLRSTHIRPDRRRDADLQPGKGPHRGPVQNRHSRSEADSGQTSRCPTSPNSTATARWVGSQPGTEFNAGAQFRNDGEFSGQAKVTPFLLLRRSGGRLRTRRREGFPKSARRTRSGPIALPAKRHDDPHKNHPHPPNSLAGGRFGSGRLDD